MLDRNPTKESNAQTMNPYRMIPLPVAWRERPTEAEIRRMFPHLPKDAVFQDADTCSQNSVLALVGKSPLLPEIHQAAKGSGCRVKIAESWSFLFEMPALLAIIDPTLVEPNNWDTVCEVFQDAGPENVKFLLTGLSPHSQTLPIHNVVSMPFALNAASLQSIMRSLRDRPPVIAACAPHYPGIIAKMPREFTVSEFLWKFAEEHRELAYNALEAYSHSPNEERTVSRLMAGQLYDFPTLVERVSSELPIHLAPDGEWAARWRKKK